MGLFLKKKRVRSFTHAPGKRQVKRDTYHTVEKTWWEIAKEVRIRDGEKCTKCGITEKQSQRMHKKGLQVHHIKELSRGGRTVKSNLATVCCVCHSTFHHHM